MELREAAQQALEAWRTEPGSVRMASLMMALEAALAEPVQEPVAWRCANATPPGGYVIFQQYPQALEDLGHPIEPLYTAPPQRKPLTEEEIVVLFNKLVQDRPAWPERRYRDFARYVERAHGIE